MIRLDPIFGDERLPERFWEKVQPEPNTGCWLWTASVARGGYGQFWGGAIEWRLVRAHRVAYQVLVGPIPEGLVTDHLCRTPACVNPAHLEPVTKSVNALRGIPGERSSHCLRGHPLQGDESDIYVSPRGLRFCRPCRIIHARRHARKRAAA